MANHSTSQDENIGLQKLGFLFHPFERLEASNDAYIHEYLIGHEMFAVAWEAASAILFAPAGGGKTAMRIYTQRACWLSSGQRRKFPVSYDLPLLADLSNFASIRDHKTPKSSAAATDLWLACVYQPELYLNLSPDRRVSLLSVLRQALPTDLSWSLSMLEESTDPKQLSAHLDRTYVLPELPTREEISQFCQAIRLDLMHKPSADTPSSLHFDALLEFIVNDLGFSSVFILLDGIDGTNTLAINPQSQTKILEPLFDQALVWAKKRFFLKAFLPLDLEPIIAEQYGIVYRQLLHATITWDIPKLAEILRRRTFVASQGKFGSLDALSSPALRDTETMIAQRSRPLPREAIVLARLVLDNYLARNGENPGYLEPEDIANAEVQYQKGVFP